MATKLKSFSVSISAQFYMHDKTNKNKHMRLDRPGLEVIKLNLKFR